jgi:long-chain fatty acid transport protein
VRYSGRTSTNLHCGNGRLGVDLMQLIVAPTAAYKIAPNHSIGVAPLLGYQMFEAEGLQLFRASRSIRAT